MICRTLIAALGFMTLLQPPALSADAAEADAIARPPAFVPSPPATETEKPRQEVPPAAHYVIRDPATVTVTQAKHATDAADFISPRHVLPAQATEEIFDTQDVFPDLTDDVESNLNAPEVSGESAAEGKGADFPAAERQNNRLPIRPARQRRDPSYANQPWTITELFNEPEDYNRQMREQEFCSQVWSCAGGRNQGCMRRWRRDMRRRHEMRGIGRFGCTPSLLFSGMIMEPILGYGFFGAPMGVCGGCSGCHVSQSCASETCGWDGFCADGTGY